MLGGEGQLGVLAEGGRVVKEGDDGLVEELAVVLGDSGRLLVTALSSAVEDTQC